MVNQTTPLFDRTEESHLQSLIENCLLIVVATDVEHDYALRYLKPLPGKPKPFAISIKEQLFHVGLFGSCRTVVIKSEMGNSTPDATSSTTMLAILKWKPALAIMVGICWGNQKVQGIAMLDILAPDNIIAFDHARLTGGDIDYRLTHRELDRDIVHLLEIDKSTSKWAHDRGDGETPAIRMGSLLSGQKLIDDADVRDKLLAQTKTKLNITPIGGEMEGYAFANTCIKLGIKYFIVKSVCDWAEKKEKGWQRFSANAAFSYCNKLLSNQLNIVALGFKGNDPIPGCAFDGISHEMVKQEFAKNFYDFTLTLSGTRLYRDLSSFNYRAFTSLLYELVDNEFKYGEARSLDITIRQDGIEIHSNGHEFNQLIMRGNGLERGCSLALNKWYELGQDDNSIKSSYPLYNVKNGKNVYSFAFENLVPMHPVISLKYPKKAHMVIKRLASNDGSISTIAFDANEKISVARSTLEQIKVKKLENDIIEVVCDKYLYEMLTKIFNGEKGFRFDIADNGF